MKAVVVLAFAGVALLAAEHAFATERVAADLHVAPAKPGELCAQVISCGTKSGKRKEYATPCPAKADGATHITPKSGPTC
jgi:hypothetical protein